MVTCCSRRRGDRINIPLFGPWEMNPRYLGGRSSDAQSSASRCFVIKVNLSLCPWSILHPNHTVVIELFFAKRINLVGRQKSLFHSSPACKGRQKTSTTIWCQKWDPSSSRLGRNVDSNHLEEKGFQLFPSNHLQREEN